MIQIEKKQLLQTQLTEVRNKLYTLYSNQTRKRRGLVNIVGNSARWLFSTMDEEDGK